ncbi:MAG: redox-sensing transcriptional repressor Rex [Oscillospiraceae bacterium]|jgi:redox-sensing transcriptional repressor
MKRSKVSPNVIRRLPRYLRYLDELSSRGVERISSKELSNQMKLTPSQIRQDFSCFGEFGQQGYGYNIANLRDAISNILGMNRQYSVVLVGVGNLGHAIVGNFNFSKRGFRLLGAFDVSPALVGSAIADTQIFHADTLPAFLAEHHVDIVVLTVPKRIANAVATMVVKNGVKAIWNFTDIELDVKNSDVLVEDIHFSDSLLSLSYYLTEAAEAEETED